MKDSDWKILDELYKTPNITKVARGLQYIMLMEHQLYETHVFVIKISRTVQEV